MVSIPHQSNPVQEAIAAVSMARYQLGKLDTLLDGAAPDWVHACRGEIEDRKPWVDVQNRINDAMNLAAELEDHLCGLMAAGLNLHAPSSQQRGDSGPSLRFRGRIG